MQTAREELIASCLELRALCGRAAVTGVATFDAICVVLRRIADLASHPEVSASALDVRFKAEDLFVRTHLMSESILRLMLDDRVQRLDALVRVRAGTPRDRRAPGQRGRRASDRVPPPPG